MFHDADEEAYFAGSVLMERADHVMAVVGNGVKVTDTETLPRAETNDLLTRFRIDRKVNSMWDVAEVGTTWFALTGAGFLTIDAGRAPTRCPGRPRR